MLRSFSAALLPLWWHNLQTQGGTGCLDVCKLLKQAAMGMPKGRESHQLSIIAGWQSQQYGKKLSVFPESCATDKVKVSAQA